MKKFKTEILDIDWLDDIQSMTVSKAIEYLKTLNQDSTLEFGIDSFRDSDCYVNSSLELTTPVSDKEIHEIEITELNRQIKDAEIMLLSAKHECSRFANDPESAIKTFKQATLTYYESTLIELQNELKELTKNGQY